MAINAGLRSFYVRAKLRVMVRRILRKYGYPPDKQEKATLTVLERAELLRGDIAS
jgi:type I restriction enzyme, R subunit